MSFTEENPAEIPPEPPAPVRSEAMVALSPRAGRGWMENNWLPLVLFLAAVAGAIGSGIVRAAVLNRGPIERTSTHVQIPSVDVLEERLAKAPGALARGGVFVVSLLLFAGLCINHAFFPKERALLDYVFAPAPPRVVPAVTLLDALLALASGIFISSMLAAVVFPGGALSGGEFSAYSFLCGMLGLLGGVIVLCIVAVWRAGGGHGREGLVPFWTPSRHAPSRSVLDDISFGLVIYLITFAPILLTGAFNKAVVKALGIQPDQHSLITELLQPQPLWVLVVFVYSATFGAAFLEEILFRGGVYNGCRRFLGGGKAALLAAAIFSATHFIHTDFIPLMMLGLVMIWLYERTGRLVASMAFHFANNLFSVLTILTLRDYLQ